jgi:signal transduction histidine kinase
MMDRVIDNLGRNAGRPTPPGTSVWVSVRPTPEGARLVVEDDGPGVPPDERDRVFEPFQQGETASLQPSPGTGIGLALVRRFVEAHGGTVTLDERPGGGARFAIDLPRAQAT